MKILIILVVIDIFLNILALIKIFGIKRLMDKKNLKDEKTIESIVGSIETIIDIIEK